MDNSTPASGLIDHTANVHRLKEEAGVIPNGEVAMKLVEMWEYAKGSIIR